MSDRFPDWMKFSDASSSRAKSKTRGRRKKNLKVSFSKRLMGSVQDLPVQMVVASVAVALALCIGLWFGAKSVGQMLFAKNPIFTIQHLDIGSSDRVAMDYIRGKLRIDSGANLFGVNIATARTEFLKYAPHYKSMEITRLLPDTMRIVLVERDPIARFGRKGGFVVDAQGYVFGPRRRGATQPALQGYQGPVLKPGDRLTGLASDAVAVLDFCRKADFDQDIVIESIDVEGGFGGRKDSICLHLEDRVEVELWWERSAEGAVTPDLHDRLAFLRNAIRTERSNGNAINTVNLTLDGYRRNMPITYWE